MYLHDDKLRTVTLNLTVKLISHVYQNTVSSCLSFLTLTLSNFTIYNSSIASMCLQGSFTLSESNFFLLNVNIKFDFFLDEEKPIILHRFCSNTNEPVQLTTINQSDNFSVIGILWLPSPLSSH